MNIKFLTLLLFLVRICFGQTENLTKVSGTKCSLIPPKGFITSSTFSGFQNNEKGASIMINEIPAPYQQLIDGLTAPALKTKGITLLSKEIIDFQNSRATLFSVTQPANGTTFLKQMLIFGDSTWTVLVNGIYPETSKDIELEIKEAILTTVYTATQMENPLEAAMFTIETTGTEFKVIKYLSGMLLYSTDGKIPTEKPTLIVGNSLDKLPSDQSQSQFALDRLKKLQNGEFSIIKSSNQILIDNLKGYEIVAEGKSKNNLPELTYQVMLFNEEGDYFIILGQTKEDFQKYLDTFKKIALTFKLK